MKYALASVLVVATACGVDSVGNGPRPSVDPGNGDSGLPCEVVAALATCQSCHGSPLSGGAPVPLRTYTDLMRTATTGETLAERAVIRMQDAASPMPPAPSAPAAATDISALQDWINAGMPQGSCSLVEDPLNDPSTACANGRWSGGESERMEPGGACNQCHRQEGEGPRYSIAGTVYSSGHQQNRCYGVSTGVQVVITGADGRQFPLNPNSSGNFTLSSSQLMTPYTAKVVDTTTGAERVMVTPQTEGDCNTCHTQTGSGTPPAPGRITVPIQ